MLDNLSCGLSVSERKSHKERQSAEDAGDVADGEYQPHAARTRKRIAL